MKKAVLLFTVAAVTLCTGLRSLGQNIYTFAGVAGTNGYTGDDSLATLARLSGPAGIAAASGGVVYFTDSRNHALRKVASSGVITTIAGNGTGAYAGDGGPASAAQLRNPLSVAVDATGNIFIADSRNNAIRKIDGSGIITTVAGTGTAGYTGDGGPASAARLRNPSGVAVDATGNIYIADSRNHVIRMVNTTGVISTIAGNNTPGYTGDFGPATAAQLNNPLGIAVTGSGTIFIADSRNNVVRKISPSGVIKTLAGNGTSGYSGNGGPASAAQLALPNDVKLDGSGNVFISDSNNTVRMINSGDTITAFAGTSVAGYTGDGGAATAAKMTGPSGLAIDAAHNVYISTQGNNVIRRVGSPITGIHITSNTGVDTVCIGHVTNFTASPIAYATPHYQWQQNGTNVGTDAATYTPASLASGDIVDCILLSAAGGTMLAMSNNMRIDSLPRTGTITGNTLFCLGSNDVMRDLGVPPGSGTWYSSNTTVATIAPSGLVTSLSLGATTIYYVFSNACGTDSASHALTVVANTIGPISGPSVVCQGATVTYTDTTADGRWRTRNGPFGTIDSLTGVFTAGFIIGPDVIIYGISRSCYRIDTILIDSLPVMSAITGPTVVDSSLTITLFTTSPGGVWSSSDNTIATVGSSTGIVTGVKTGTVTITYTITSPGGCSNDTTYQVTVISTEGVPGIINSNSVNIYPNPASGSVNITWANQHANKANCIISDVTGRQVMVTDIDMKTTSGSNKMDISGLKPGLYMVSLKSESGVYSQKLMVE